MMEMAEIVTRFSELVRTEFPQESELRSETSAAVPHKVSLNQVKVRRPPTASAQQSQIAISEVPAG